MPATLFWMAGTDTQVINTWSPLAASVLLDYGMLGVFMAGCEYIIHPYGSFAGPALSFNTFTRYAIAGIMVEVAPCMWRKLGIRWALIVLGCCGVGYAPVPYVLFWWGHRFAQGAGMCLDKVVGRWRAVKDFGG